MGCIQSLRKQKRKTRRKVRWGGITVHPIPGRNDIEKNIEIDEEAFKERRRKILRNMIERWINERAERRMITSGIGQAMENEELTGVD